jgi:HD-like signal output (HDOD) protein
VIAEDADFKESVTGLVLSMRDQMEHFKEDAKVQSRRFYISTAIAVASIAVTVAIAVVAMLV